MYCCSGCALAARLSRDGTNAAADNAPLVLAASLAFVAFNQLLFWLLAVLLAVQPDGAVNAARFVWLSLLAGLGLWLAGVVVQWRLGARQGMDMVVIALTGALLGLGLFMRNPICVLAGTATFALWALRGARRKQA